VGPDRGEVRRRAGLTHRLLLVLPAVFLVAAVPRLSPAPPGTILREVSAPLPQGGAYTVIASRSSRGTGHSFQYYLSIYAAWPGKAWHLVYTSRNNPDHLIPEVLQGHGTSRFFPKQRLNLLGVVSPERAAPLAVAEMHNAAADCGEATVMLLGPQEPRRFGPVVAISNPCGLTATIAGHHIVLHGPYYARGAPLYAPTIPKAVAILRRRAGGWVETPPYFTLRIPPDVSPSAHGEAGHPAE
jgi:hypothetical protein